MTELMQQMRGLIAAEGDYGFLMAADEFENSNDRQNVVFGKLLRQYVEIQTYVRMGQPIPVHMADNFKKLNDEFPNEHRAVIQNYYGANYNQPFGPFFLQLTCSQAQLAANMNWLEINPVRELDLNGFRPTEDLKMILRNHRFQNLKRLRLWPDYNTRNIADLAAVIRGMISPNLLSMSIRWGVYDRLGLLKSAFASNRTIPKGCEFFMGTDRLHVKR